MKKILLSSLLASILTASLIDNQTSSYEYATYKNSSAVKSALKTNGLTVIGEYDAMQDKNYHIIVYTCPTLKKDASKENRAFAAVQKVLINNNDKELVLTNPEYFLHAFMQDDFMQDDFNEDHAKRVNKKLSMAFGTLKDSEDGLDDDDIADYHFMIAMPYYEDMIEVAQGTDLEKRLEANAANKIVFKIDTGKALLYGIAMQGEKGEAYFINEIKGKKSSAFLPYMIMIEDNKAKILHPKYYLAIAYPNLSMGEFMSIQNTPGDIEEYMTKLFK